MHVSEVQEFFVIFQALLRLLQRCVSMLGCVRVSILPHDSAPTEKLQFLTLVKEKETVPPSR